MKYAIAPCRPKKKSPTPCARHRWVKGRCSRCGIRRRAARVQVCDCGCGTVITDETQVTRYRSDTYVFGHETLDLFETRAACP